MAVSYKNRIRSLRKKLKMTQEQNGRTALYRSDHAFHV